MFKVLVISEKTFTKNGRFNVSTFMFVMAKGCQVVCVVSGLIFLFIDKACKPPSCCVNFTKCASKVEAYIGSMSQYMTLLTHVRLNNGKDSFEENYYRKKV